MYQSTGQKSSTTQHVLYYYKQNIFTHTTFLLGDSSSASSFVSEVSSAVTQIQVDRTSRHLSPQPIRSTHNYSSMTTGFVQKLRCFFPGFSRTCKDQIPGFSRTKKSFFPGLSRTRSIHKHGLHEVKKVHIQNQLSVYLHYSKESEMQYLRFYYFI